MKKFLYVLLFGGAGVFADDPVYFDVAASYPSDELALKEFLKVSRMLGNSSGFNTYSKKLKKIEEDSAKTIAERIHCDASQILFTPSATVSNNIAILGVAYKNPKCHLITSKIEHKSVLSVFRYLESIGYSVTYLSVDAHGQVDLNELEASIRPETRLVSIQSFNSEIGSRQNLKTISTIVHNHKNIVFHSDVSQSFGKYQIDFSLLDLATFSGYKIGAPKGIAALYIKDRSVLSPIMFGSGDELLPGTKPTALIASFATAVKNFKFDSAKVEKNFLVLKEEIEKIPDVVVNSDTPSHVLSVSIKGVLLKDLIEALEGWAFSSGCSCSGQGESEVMQAIRQAIGKYLSCTLRISFPDKIDSKILVKFAKKLKEEVERLRKLKTVDSGCESDEKKMDPLKSVLKTISETIGIEKTDEKSSLTQEPEKLKEEPVK